MFINHYEVLGLSKKATSTEIKKRYRVLALKFHPDVNKSHDAHDVFIRIHTAYEILCNDEERAYYNVLYDRYINSLKGEPLNTKDHFYSHYTKQYSEAKKKAYQHSKSSFTVFKHNVIDSISAAYSTSIEVGTLLLSIFFVGVGVYGIKQCIHEIVIGGDGFLLPPWPSLVIALIFLLSGLSYIYQSIRSM